MKTNSDTTPAVYLGLDVHKEKTSVAIAAPGAKGEIRLHGEVALDDSLMRAHQEGRAIPVSYEGVDVPTNHRKSRTERSADLRSAEDG